MLGYNWFRGRAHQHSNKNLYKAVITFSHHIKFSFAISQPWQTSCRRSIIKSVSIIELNSKYALIIASATIYRQIHFSLNAPWNCVASSFH